MNTSKSIIAIAVFAIATGVLATLSNAQPIGAQDHFSSCSERGGCPYERSSVGRVPYGPNTSYGSATSYHNDYRGLFRAPYPGEGSRYRNSGGCGYGGTCGHARPSHLTHQHDHGQSGSNFARRFCPYEQGRFDQVSWMRSNPAPYGSNYPPRNYHGQDYNDRNYNDRNVQGNYPDRRGFSTQFQRGPEFRQQSPADMRPALRSPQSYAPGKDFRSDRLRPSDLQLVPATSTQFTPPPELPPQPTGDTLRKHSLLLPPTNGAALRESATDHAGHDHAGHDHAGHNH